MAKLEGRINDEGLNEGIECNAVWNWTGRITQLGQRCGSWGLVAVAREGRKKVVLVVGKSGLERCK